MFDNICKFLAENFSSDFASWLLGESVTLTELSPQELSLEPIRADALILLQSDEVVLHIEFQTEPKANIPFRMTDYRLRVYRRFPHKKMLQVVIYLQQTNSEKVHQKTFTLERTRHEFDVIRVWEQDPDVFLQSSGLLPFAVLSNTSNRTATLEQAAREIFNIADQSVQSNVAAATSILAGLVLEKGVIQRVLRKDIMQESVIYQEIREEALVEGVQRVAVNLLREGMSVDMIARVTGLTVEQIQQLQATDVKNQQE